MKKNRIVSALLALLMTVSSIAAFVMPASADDTYPDITVTAENTKGLFEGNVDYTRTKEKETGVFHGEYSTKLVPLEPTTEATATVSWSTTPVVIKDQPLVVEGYDRVPANTSMLDDGIGDPTKSSHKKFIDPEDYRYMFVKYYYEAPDGTPERHMYLNTCASLLGEIGYTAPGQATSASPLVKNEWAYAKFDLQTLSKYNIAEKYRYFFQYQLYPLGNVQIKNLTDGEVIYLASITYSTTDASAVKIVFNKGTALGDLDVTLPNYISADAGKKGISLSGYTLGDVEGESGKKYVFKGWSLSDDNDISKIVTSVDAGITDMNVYAVWELKQEGDFDDIYLQNTFHKLSVDKKLNIAFLGGSVSYGSGISDATEREALCWRGLVKTWISTNFPDATVTELCRPTLNNGKTIAIGGTGSRFASYRVGKDAMLDDGSTKVDLVFIENCINDNYESLNDLTAELQENDAVSVKKILENNPYADIVFIGTTDKSRFGGDYGALVAHRSFAEDCGFEFVNVGEYACKKLVEEFGSQGAATSDANWGKYFSDIVHPYAAGYALYAECIIDKLFKPMVEKNVSAATYVPTLDQTINPNRAAAKAAYDSINANRDITTNLSSLKGYGQYATTYGFGGTTQLTGKQEGAAVAFKFNGTNARLWTSKNGTNGVYEVYLDGSKTPTNTIDLWRDSTGGQQHLLAVSETNLAKGEHTVTLVLKKNAAHGGLDNYISNIAVLDGLASDIEFIDVPEELKPEVKHENYVVTPAKLNLAIDANPSPRTLTTYAFQGEQIDVLKFEPYTEENKAFAVDGYNIKSAALPVSKYTCAELFMYVDDPEGKTAGFHPVLRHMNGVPNATVTAAAEVTPNAWQKILIDNTPFLTAIAQSSEHDENTQIYNQYHLHPLSMSTNSTMLDGVTVYLAALTFFYNDNVPDYYDENGKWVDSNPNLTGVFVNGMPVEGFAMGQTEYNIELPFGTTEVPTLEATCNTPDALPVITQAASVTGKATLVYNNVTYTFNFSVDNKTYIEGFEVDGKAYAAFAQNKYKYTVNLKSGSAVPTITAIVSGNPAGYTVNQAATLDDVATIVCGDLTYEIGFTTEPSIEERYPDAAISGADGVTIEAAVAAATKANSGDVVVSVNSSTLPTTNTTLFSIADAKGDVILTSEDGAEADFAKTLKITGGTRSDVTTILDGLKVFVNGTSNSDFTLYTRGNNITITETFDNSHLSEERKGVNMILGLGDDGGSFTVDGSIKANVLGGVWSNVWCGGWGGTDLLGGIDYTIGGKAEVKTFYAGNHGVNPTKYKESAEGNTIKGDINVHITGDAKITNAFVGNGGVIDGSIYYLVDGGTISQLSFKHGSTAVVTGITGSATATLAGGQVGKVVAGPVETVGKQGIVYYEDAYANSPVTLPETGLNNLVTVKGTDYATDKVDLLYFDGKAYIVGSTEKKYIVVNGDLYNSFDGSAATLTAVGNEFAIEIEEGNAEVFFTDGYVAKFMNGNEIFYTFAGTKEGDAIVAPKEAPVGEPHKIFKGWAKSGTTEIVEDYGTVGVEETVFVAIFEDEPTYTITLVNGSTTSEITGKYEGESFEFPDLDDTPDARFLGWSLDKDAAAASFFGGDYGKVSGNATYYAVFKVKSPEDAEYDFVGRFDAENEKYTLDIIFDGPTFNMTALGFEFPIAGAGDSKYFDIALEDGLAFSGIKDFEQYNGSTAFFDVIYATAGKFDGGKKIATVTFGMTADQYMVFDFESSFVPLALPVSINAAYVGGVYQYCKAGGSALDVEGNLYDIVFGDFDEDRTVEVEFDYDEGKTTLTAEETGEMFVDYVFTAETTGAQPVVSYSIAGGEEKTLTPDGSTYTIPGDEIIGSITVTFVYGTPIEEAVVEGVGTPKTGSKPATAEEVKAPYGAPYFVESVEWEPADEAFAPNVAYTIRVTVAPSEGSVFTPDTVASIDGDKEVSVYFNDDGTITIEKTFPETAAEYGKITGTIVFTARDAKVTTYNNFMTVTALDANGARYVLTEGSTELPAITGKSCTVETELPAGTYTILIEKQGYLTDAVYNFVVAANKTADLGTIDLVPGQVAGAQTIDLEDFGAIVRAFTEGEDAGKSDIKTIRASLDIDEDGYLTVFDLNQVKINFGKTGKDA